MLTTVNNPFNPFIQNDEWRAFDRSMGYYTDELLDSVAKLSNDMSPLDESIEIERAIDEIVKYNIIGLYRKVSLVNDE